MAASETWLFSVVFVVLWKEQWDLVEDNSFECFGNEWKERDRSVFFYKRSVNVGFLSSGVTRGCLNAVGKNACEERYVDNVLEKLLGEGARGLGLEDML